MAKNPCHGITHVIKEGDTLYTISRSYRVPLGLLLRSNPYLDIYNLQIGDEICIPCMKYNSPGAMKPGEARPGAGDDCPYAGKPPFYKYPACKEITNPYGNDSVTPREMKSMQDDSNYNGRDMVYDGNDSDAISYNKPAENDSHVLFDYVTGEGDTLGSILSRFDLTLYEFLKHNDKEAINLLPETILKIPRKAMDL